jgi:hypothetical protein
MIPKSWNPLSDKYHDLKARRYRPRFLTGDGPGSPGRAAVLSPAVSCFSDLFMLRETSQAKTGVELGQP